MVKNKFFKNLYQSITFGGTAAIIIFALLLGYFETLTYDDPGNAWLYLVFSAGIILLFFAIGFYWIFQTIEIDQKGIQVKIFRKTIRTVFWADVVGIEEQTVMRNPALVVTARSQKCLILDKRKKILKAISFYSNDKIEVKFFRPQLNRTGKTGQ